MSTQTPDDAGVAPAMNGRAPYEPPHSVQGEQNVLGAILADPAQWDRVAPMLIEHDFVRLDHRLIWRAMQTLQCNRLPLNVVALAEHLRLGEERQHFGETGGLAYLGTLARETLSPTHCVSYANIVRSHANRRALFELGERLVDPQTTIQAALADAEATLDSVQARGTKPKGVQLIAIDVCDFLSRDIPRRAHILAPPIPEQGLVMVYGPRGLGKTQVSVGIAVAVACGGTFLKWSAPQPAGVLLIDGEMPAAAMQARLASAITVSDRELSAPLRLITPDLNWESGMPDLSTLAGQQSVDSLVTDDIRLIIVDNLSSLLRSGVENDAESWLPLQTWALRHRAAGRSVLFIHHAGKGGAQRGTSRREDVLDTVIALRRPSDYRQSEGARFEVHFEKGRSLFGNDAKAFEAQLQVDEHGRAVWTMKDLEANQDKQISELAELGMKPGEIAQELGVSRATIYRRMPKGAHG